MSGETVSKLFHVFCELTRLKKAVYFRVDDDGSAIYYAWVGGDVFQLKYGEERTIFIEFQTVSTVSIRGTSEWELLNHAMAEAVVDDELMYEARRHVAVDAVIRLKARLS